MSGRAEAILRRGQCRWKIRAVFIQRENRGGTPECWLKSEYGVVTDNSSSGVCAVEAQMSYGGWQVGSQLGVVSEGIGRRQALWSRQ
jgi:hypothetical protein